MHLNNGAHGGTRTHTPLRATDFESVTSTNSITRAYKTPYGIRTHISDLFWSQMFSI